LTELEGKLIFRAKQGIDLDGDSFYSTYTRWRLTATR
jgi:hypothetical protein